MTLKSLIAYVPWQLRDILPRAFVPMVLFGVFAGLPIAVATSSHAPEMTPEQFGQFLRTIFTGVAPLCFTLGGFLFMTRSIAEDRERQHTRFYFSHPVSPSAFYLSRFVVGLMAFLACFLPVPLAFLAYGADISLLGTMGAMLVALLLIGGLTTVCAALSNKDGVVLIIAYVASQAVHRAVEQGLTSAALRPLAAVLPPIDTMNDVMETMLRAGSWDLGDIAHVALYGLGLLAVGLFLLRRGPLVR